VLPQALNAADLLVLTSVAEAFGLVLIEAMSCGLPVIAAEAPGPAEIVAAGTGRLVPPDDKDVLADALVTAASDACPRLPPPVPAEEEADDGTSEANSLGCASQQDSREGARRGREEASKVACPDREEGASKAQATEEDLARQVDKSSTGRSPGAADRRPCLWQKRLSPSGAGRCVFASGILPCSASLRLPVAARLGTSRRFRD
jgi:hypothetical protein